MHSLKTALHVFGLHSSARSTSSTALETAPRHTDASQTWMVREACWPVLSSRAASKRQSVCLSCIQVHTACPALHSQIVPQARREHRCPADNMKGGRGREGGPAGPASSLVPGSLKMAGAHLDMQTPHRCGCKRGEQGPLASIILTHTALTCCMHSNTECSVCVQVHAALPAPHLQIGPPGTQTTHTPCWM